MSAKRSSFGMHHVTVVPTNFTPRDSEDAEDEKARSRDEDAPSHADTPSRDDTSSRGDTASGDEHAISADE